MDGSLPLFSVRLSTVRPTGAGAVHVDLDEAERVARQLAALPDRVHAKIALDPLTGCWNWEGYVTPLGYGQVQSWIGPRRVGVSHRLVYESLRGPVAPGLDLDHLCRNRRCCNPDHLDPVTRRENLMRGETRTASRAAQTHCLRGHPLSGENLYRNRNGTRACRICRAEKYREWVAANRDRRRELDRDFLARRREAKATAA